MVLLVKNPSGNSGDPRDSGPIPELGRSPGVGNGTLLQYSCLENSMGRGAWRATVHRVVELDTTERLSTQHRAHIPCQFYIFFYSVCHSWVLSIEGNQCLCISHLGVVPNSQGVYSISGNLFTLNPFFLGTFVFLTQTGLIVF